MLVGALAAASALAIVQPFQAGPASYDAGSAVIHFQRLIAGQRLEAFISTTPKPLLTLVYGSLYGLVGDWRAISWATIGAYSVAISLVTRLAWRVAGPVAGVVAAVALIASPSLVGEVLIASAVPWAMLGWSVAGLAVTGARPRYAVAGVALAVATLARLETLVLVGSALVILILVAASGRRDHRRRVPSGAWWVLLGFMALPVMLLHDWLLTGDPLFWATVSTRYSEGAGATGLLDPIELARSLTHRYVLLAPFSLLAVVGGIWLLRTRRWALALGVAALGPGLVAFLLVLAARGTFVAARYAVPADLAVLFSASLGAAAAAAGCWTWLRHRAAVARLTGPAGRAVALGAIGVATAAAGWPPALVAAPTQAAATAALGVARDEAAVVPVLEAALQSVPGARDLAAAPGQRPTTAIIPVAMRTLLAVDLRVPLTRIGSSPVAQLEAAAGGLARTDFVVHDRALDGDDPFYRQLEVAATSTVGDQTLTPLLVDPLHGVWVYAVSGP
ncbi:MAG TPA: hypothetical protein VMH24_03640 [Candidatus Sulfotelmatobacter sp.]|nr:hypothetical protein [Candidatus Sulfotelmatobacter sp.]